MSATKFGSGNVHDTYLVIPSAPELPKFILQNINLAVFSNPEWIVKNIEVFTDHVSKKIRLDGTDTLSNWELPVLIKTKNGFPILWDASGSCWRMMTFIDNTSTFQRIESSWQAFETGYALGRFHKLVSDLDPLLLHDTLPGFHITSRYLADYDQILKSSDRIRTQDYRYCTQFIEKRRKSVAILEETKRKGLISDRIIHGDPKINNILFASDSKRAIGMIDLDTVKPGLVLYDIGDCLRSGCNPSGEETNNPNEAYFDLDLAAEILKGFLPMISPFLQGSEQDLIFEAVRLLAFELGLRFFSDYLAGNVYFKTNHPEQNLVRALVQFRLTETIEAKAEQIRKLSCQTSIRHPG
jgi:Ser/Thr protein kinase RdoA (MazF antagonist)